jgi:glycosyltransferase involved in cell wall biosynthesis
MLSVIIPTRNRRQLVLRLLDRLAAQDLGADRFEVILVADGCTDDTAQVARSSDPPFSLRVVELPHSGQAAARNRGAADAACRTLVFLDDDTVPGPDFLRGLSVAIEAGADVVVSRVRVADWTPDGLLPREYREWDRHGVRVMTSGAWTMNDIHFAATAVRRDCFEALGGFDPSFTEGGAWGREDAEFGYRLLRGGCRVVYRPDVVVESDYVTDPVTMLRRARELGRNEVRFARKHPELVAELLGAGRQGARIRRAVGALVLAAPRATGLLWPLRHLVVAAIRRTWTGGVLYRLWLVVWFAEWWRGVVSAGGAALAQGERRR